VGGEEPRQTTRARPRLPRARDRPRPGADRAVVELRLSLRFADHAAEIEERSRRLLGMVTQIRSRSCPTLRAWRRSRACERNVAPTRCATTGPCHQRAAACARLTTATEERPRRLENRARVPKASWDRGGRDLSATPPRCRPVALEELGTSFPHLLHRDAVGEDSDAVEPGTRRSRAGSDSIMAFAASGVQPTICARGTELLHERPPMPLPAHRPPMGNEEERDSRAPLHAGFSRPMVALPAMSRGSSSGIFTEPVVRRARRRATAASL